MTKCRRPEIVTYGCRLNTFESEIIRKQAETAGLVETVIFNTCAVTAEAEREALSQIKKLKRDQPNLSIIVSGCAAQIDPEKFKNMAEVDLVLGNEEKLELESYLLSNLKEKIIISDIMTVKEIAGHLISGFKSRSRAFIQVQQGCNHRCTFCVIPFARGNSRSVPIEHIIKQINDIVDNGYREVVLTGVDITSYGNDLIGKPSLGQMIRHLLISVPNLERLRLSSLDPAAIDRDLLELFANEPRLMPHVHLSVQAGSDIILKRMKRRHTRKNVIELCNQMRESRANIVFGADLITGFPTETEELFDETMQLVDEADLTYLHVFPYSPRPKTPAVRMPQIDAKTIKYRSTALRKKGLQKKDEYFHSLKGKITSILVESKNRGYTETFAPVSLINEQKKGEIISALITSTSPDGLTAEQAPSVN
ncbi:MAG: tRNA (N(6)-L-threonylcarbamoyladenosine(37)-C(2))-methylthiotransferase MtaB [Pseudomonadota bacterium]|nr:tRNA (N(6)-L-threonylcarbamoyladenosine(37)-C(2))-methylthiotransferase MtaB [Pseudomonadota bacterium]